MKRVAVTPILSSAEAENIAIASAAVVYAKAFKLAYGEYFSLSYKASSASSTPSIKIELEVAIKDVLPATEGSADTNYVEPENMADIETDLTTETWHIKSLSPPTSVYARLKITGSGTNPADTIFNAHIMKQEEL